MNIEWKTKWVEALRSGKYMQGQNQLRYEGDGGVEYCCLGVLADITGQPYDDGLAALPSYIAVLVGLPSAHDRGTLARMNDNGKTFAQIADWIEKHL